MGEQQVDFLIDSGSPVTTIPLSTWIKLKEDWKAGRAKIFRWEKNGKRELLGYGSKQPLKVSCSFAMKIAVKDYEKPTVFEEIFVVEEASQALLGASAAKSMKLLKIGVEVCRLEATGKQAQANNTERFPSIPNFKLSFDIDDSVPPRKDFRYDVPQSLETSLNENLEKLTRQQIIEPAETTPRWVSRLKAVTKSNGEIRWVVTMLGPNRAIRRVYYPMPSMDKLAVKMKGSTHFSKLDIRNAFYHVELDERSREMTTFMTSKGPMRFTRLAFGVNCAPEAFQKIMEDCLRGCEGAVVFIDDILIYGRSPYELQLRTEKVKQRLKENNLTLNDEKCIYEKDRVEFLGYTIDASGMRPSTDKIKDVLECSRPTTTTGVRSFLGMVNFMASFIPNLSELSEPLRRLTGKIKQFDWGNEQDEAFKKLKEAVAHQVHTRGFFDENDETWLYTDASPVGLGAILVQGNETKDGCKQKRIIAFASKALTKTEAKYPQTQREALAVVWGVEKFHFYLIGRDFHLVVDHQPLAFIFGGDGRFNKRATTRAEGWALRLSTYRFDTQVVKSEQNIADYLSRESLHNSEPFNDYNGRHELSAITISVNPNFKNGLQAVTKRDVESVTIKDEVSNKIKEAMETGTWPSELQRYAAFQEEISSQGKMLLRGDRIIAPTALRGRLMRVAHLGHPGIVSMKRTLRRSVWWPGMDSDIERHVKQCEGCTMVSRNDPPEPMVRTTMPDEPWEYLAIDFNSPTSLGVKLLVVTDYFSRATLVRCMKETDAGRTCDQLEDLFSIYGYPACIRADNGPPFGSREFKEWCNGRGIELIHSTPWAPWMNGEVESQMRAIRKELSIAVGEKSDWRLKLTEHVFAYNRRVHPTTGEKPIEMLFKRKVRDLMPQITSYAQQGPDIDQARELDKISKYLSKERMDKKRGARESKLAVGDMVFMENKLRKGLEPRFNPSPLRIIEKLGGTVVLKNMDGVIYRRCTNQVKKANIDRTEQDLTEDGPGIGKESGKKEKITISKTTLTSIKDFNIIFPELFSLSTEKGDIEDSLALEASSKQTVADEPQTPSKQLKRNTSAEAQSPTGTEISSKSPSERQIEEPQAGQTQSHPRGKRQAVKPARYLS